MLKYLKGEKLKIQFSNKIIELPVILVQDFDLINPILRGYGATTLEAQQLKSQAVMALADRLLERAKLPQEQMTAIEGNALAFYFQFGIELDLYLPALFPKTEGTDDKGDENPLASKKPSGNSQIA